MKKGIGAGADLQNLRGRFQKGADFFDALKGCFSAGALFAQIIVISPDFVFLRGFGADELVGIEKPFKESAVGEGSLFDDAALALTESKRIAEVFDAI